MADTRRKLKSNQIKIQNLKTAVGVKKLLAYDEDGKIIDGGLPINEPNGVIQIGSAIINDNSVDLNDQWIWSYNNNIYQKLTPTSIPIPVTSTGFFRLDWIVGNTSNGIERIQGVESDTTAIAPVVPVDKIPLVQVFVDDNGIQYIEEQALSTFVRYDIGSQGLSSAQRLNARNNIQAVSKDTNDTRTGTLTQTGKLTLLTNEDGTASSDIFQTLNTSGGGVRIERRGGLTATSKGDSETNYFIFRGIDNNNNEVFRVRQGGVTKGGDAINNDDFTTLGQVNSLISNIPTESTNLSDEDFYIGYAYETIEGVETRVEVIHDKTDKDVIITDSGNIVIDTNDESKRYILTGQVTELRGVESATDGRELKIKNSGSDPIPIIANSTSAPVGSRFNFSYTLEPGEEITIVSEDSLWDLSPNNQIAFSDHLDSVNAKVSVGSDGLEVISGIFDKDTGETVTFKEFQGTPPAVDNYMILSYRGKNWVRAYDELDSRILEFESVDELSNISLTDYIRLHLGYYRKVETKGYYESGDGGGAEYSLKTTGSPSFGDVETSISGFFQLQDQSDVRVNPRKYGASESLADNSNILNQLLINNRRRRAVAVNGRYETTDAIVIHEDEGLIQELITLETSTACGVYYKGTGTAVKLIHSDGSSSPTNHRIECLIHDLNGTGSIGFEANRLVGGHVNIRTRGFDEGVRINQFLYYQVAQFRCATYRTRGFSCQGNVNGATLNVQLNSSSKTISYGFAIGTNWAGAGYSSSMNPYITVSVEQDSGVPVNLSYIRGGKINIYVETRLHEDGHYGQQAIHISQSQGVSFNVMNEYGTIQYGIRVESSRDLDFSGYSQGSGIDLYVPHGSHSIEYDGLICSNIFSQNGNFGRYTGRDSNGTSQRDVYSILPGSNPQSGTVGAGSKMFRQTPSTFTGGVTYERIVTSRGTFGTLTNYFCSGNEESREITILSPNSNRIDIGSIITVAGEDGDFVIQQHVGSNVIVLDRALTTTHTNSQVQFKAPEFLDVYVPTTQAGVFRPATAQELRQGENTDRGVTPSIMWPSWTTAQRPVGTKKIGYNGFNTTLNRVDVWNGEDWTTAVPNATTTSPGIVELATNAETIAGTDTERVVPPAGLQAKLDATILKATAPLDFPSIPAGESATLTVTVTGAAGGDPVIVGTSSSVYAANNSTVDAWVSSTNTVTVRVRNNGTSAVDPGSVNFNIRVFK